MGYHKNKQQEEDENSRSISEDAMEVIEKLLSIVELVAEGEISQLESDEHQLFSSLLPLLGLGELKCEEAACTVMSILTKGEIAQHDLVENPYFCSDECTARALGLDQE